MAILGCLLYNFALLELHSFEVLFCFVNTKGTYENVTHLLLNNLQITFSYAGPEDKNWSYSSYNFDGLSSFALSEKNQLVHILEQCADTARNTGGGGGRAQ